MPSGQISVSANIAGGSFIDTVTKTADHQQGYEVEIGVGTAESTFNQTNETICVVTLAAGHGLTNGTYDAFWSESSVDKIAVGCTGVVDGNDITLSAAVSGDNFPAADPEDMVICEQTIINTTIDGDNVKMLAISPVCTNASETEDVSIDFQDVNSAQIYTPRIPANEAVTWWDGSGITNPMAGDPITHCHVSNQSTNNAQTVKILVLEDSTP